MTSQETTVQHQKLTDKVRHMKKKTWRLIGILVILAIMVGAASYTVFIKPHQSDTKMVYVSTPVTKGNLTVGVTESGSLTYGVTKQSYDINISTSETETSTDESDEANYLQVEKVSVVTGQRIKKGDSLLKFTDTSIKTIRRNLTNAKTEAEVALEEAKEEYNVEAIAAKGTYDQSVAAAGNASTAYNITVQNAQNTIDVDKVQIANYQEDILNLKASIPDAEDTMADAKDDLADAKSVYDAVGTSNQIVSIKYQGIYLTAKSAYDSAQSAIDKINDSIQSDEDSIKKLQEEVDLNTAKLSANTADAQSALSAAKVTGSEASKTYKAKLESLQTTIEDDQKDVSDLTNRLNAFEAFIGDGAIYAKNSGIVTEVDYKVGDYLESKGTMVAYATSGDMSISVDVEEEDIVDLAVGDPANITFTAYPKEQYTGKITAITTTSTSSSSATVSYPVTISVSGDTSKLYSGMTADVTFVTEEHKNTVYVAKSAIVQKDNKNYVYVLKNGSYVLQPVVVGLSNGIEIEVTSGLKGGETVYIASEVSISAASTSSASEGTSASDASKETNSSGDTNQMQNGNLPEMNGGGGMPGGMGGGQ